MRFSIKNLKATDYLITPRDIYRGALYVIQRIKVRDIVGLLLVGGLFTTLRFVLNISGDSLFFVPFIVAVIYWNLDARVSFGLALATLAAIPVFLILFNQAILLTGEYWAEALAVWTYYFLVIGTLKQFAEYILANRNKRQTKTLVKKKSTQHQKQIVKTMDSVAPRT